MLDKVKIKEEFKMLKNEVYTKKSFRGSKKRQLITFKYLLPFRMPIKEIENIDFIAEENTFMKFIHREHNIFEKDNIKRERQTYIEITSVINKNQFKRVKSGSTSRESKKTRVLTEVFNNQFNTLNNFIKIISVKYQYHNVFQLSLGDILSIPYYVIYSMEGEIKDMSLFLINKPGKIEEDQYSELKKSELLNIKQNYQIFTNHPSNTYVIAMRKGERAIYKADYNVAIIQIQTALEVFITKFLERYYKLDQQLSDGKISNKLAGGYRNIIKDQLLKIVRKLNLNNSYEIENCINQYIDNYYPMRNKIVHEGLSYSKDEALKFQAIVNDLIRLLVFNMKNAMMSDFSKEFNMYNIHNENINMESIKEKYK